MAKSYEGIEEDAFLLASAYFGVMSMVMKDATIDEIVNFLANREETDLPNAACRILNGGVTNPVPIMAGGLRLVVSNQKAGE